MTDTLEPGLYGEQLSEGLDQSWEVQVRDNRQGQYNASDLLRDGRESDALIGGGSSGFIFKNQKMGITANLNLMLSPFKSKKC